MNAVNYHFDLAHLRSIRRKTGHGAIVTMKPSFSLPHGKFNGNKESYTPPIDAHVTRCYQMCLSPSARPVKAGRCHFQPPDVSTAHAADISGDLPAPGFMHCR